jgi:hypothetical protein
MAVMKLIFAILFLYATKIIAQTSEHSPAELNFINEVNLVRTHPKAYAVYVKEYALKWGTPEEKEAAPEAITILDTMKPIQPLNVSNEVRKELENHNGVDSIKRWVNHGNFKWLITPYKSGGENIIMSCTNTYRNMVIRHLIDANIPTRGHRKKILDTEVNAIAVRRIVFGDESKPFQCRIWWIEEYLEL